MEDKMEGGGSLKKIAWSWSFLEGKLLVRTFDVAQETWPPESSPNKKKEKKVLQCWLAMDGCEFYECSTCHTFYTKYDI